jgi:pimeloyl-ACP methyl ester carboxylesterase
VKSFFRRFLLPLLRTYALLVGVIFIGQRWMIYHPTRGSESEIVAEARTEALGPWKDASGRIIGWKRDFSRPSKPANKLIVFHGNAGSAINREPYVAGFESLDDNHTWEVFLFEYPGYGARPGKPNRDTINDAAHAAVIELLTMDDRPVFVLGESLGSGAACEIAARESDRVRGIVLITPFSRLANVAQSAMPFIPAGLMLRDRWDNLTALKQSNTPVAVLIAGCDEVVGCQEGERLFTSLGDRPKRRWFFPQARHNTLEFHPGAAWWSEVSKFLQSSSPSSLLPPR